MGMRVVVCAANRSKTTGKIVCGARHWDNVMRQEIKGPGSFMPPEWREAEQGFIDQWGVFMTREEAYKVAKEANQIKYYPEITNGKTLYSENLY